MNGLYIGTALGRAATIGDVALALACGLLLGYLAGLFL